MCRLQVFFPIAFNQFNPALSGKRRDVIAALDAALNNINANKNANNNDNLNNQQSQLNNLDEKNAAATGKRDDDGNVKNNKNNGDNNNNNGNTDKDVNANKINKKRGLFVFLLNLSNSRSQ